MLLSVLRGSDPNDRLSGLALLLFGALGVFAVFPAQTAQAQLQKNDFTFRAVTTGSFPIGPEQLSASYSAGRGLNTGIGVYLNSDFDLQTTVGYTKYDLSAPQSLSSNLLRPGLNPPSSFANGGDLTRFTVGVGLKWQLSSSQSFRTYLRGIGHLSQFTRQKYLTGPGTLVNGRLPLNVRQESQLATGFSVGLGFLFPLGYTSAVILEPSFTTHYADVEIIRAFDLRFGLVLGEF